MIGDMYKVGDFYIEITSNPFLRKYDGVVQEKVFFKWFHIELQGPQLMSMTELQHYRKLNDEEILAMRLCK